MSDNTEEGMDKLQGLFQRAMEAREMAQMLKTQLEKDEIEINTIIDVMADALRHRQHANIMADRQPYASLSVAAACMMIMYSIWHQIVQNVDEADREEQFHLLRIAFMALMSDMKYNEPKEQADGNEGA